MSYHTQAELNETRDRLNARDGGDGSKIVTDGTLTRALRVPLL
jgi:hypothetical protein